MAQTQMRPRMVRLPDDMYEEVERIAASDDRSAAWVIRKAIAEYTRRNEPGPTRRTA